MSSHIVQLDFWGVGVRVELPTKTDQEHFRFQFRNHLTDTAVQDLTVIFRSDGADPWCRAVLDPEIGKTVWIRKGDGETELYDAWTKGSTQPSPLPPLTFPPFSGIFRAIHGSCALPSNDGPGLVMTGESGAGKSSALLYLLDSGYWYGGDDLVPVSPSGVHPYLRTMNIRSATLRTLSTGLRARIRRYGRPMETPSGVTYLVHPADLGYPVSNAGPVTQVHRVHLTAADSFTADVTADGRLAIGWDAPRHRSEAIRAVEEYVESTRPFRFAVSRTGAPAGAVA